MRSFFENGFLEQFISCSYRECKVGKKKRNKCFRAIIFYEKKSTGNKYLKIKKSIEKNGSSYMVKKECMISWISMFIKKYITCSSKKSDTQEKDTYKYRRYHNLIGYLHVTKVIGDIYDSYPSKKNRKPKDR